VPPARRASLPTARRPGRVAFAPVRAVLVVGVLLLTAASIPILGPAAGHLLRSEAGSVPRPTAPPKPATSFYCTLFWAPEYPAPFGSELGAMYAELCLRPDFDNAVAQWGELVGPPANHTNWNWSAENLSVGWGSNPENGTSIYFVLNWLSYCTNRTYGGPRSYCEFQEYWSSTPPNLTISGPNLREYAEACACPNVPANPPSFALSLLGWVVLVAILGGGTGAALLVDREIDRGSSARRPPSTPPPPDPGER